MKLTKRVADEVPRRGGVGPGAADPAAGTPGPDVAPVVAPSPWADLPGAVVGEGPDAGVPAHLGRPAQEQWALEAGTAAVHLPLRVVTVTGADRLTWLHSLTTQHLTGLAAGTATELLVLDPHGHVEHAAAVVDDGTTTWLLTEDTPVSGTRLETFLDSMRFAMRVEVAVRDDLAVVGTLRPAEGGPTTLEGVLAARAAGPVWVDPWPDAGAGTTTYGAPSAEHPGAGHRAVLAPVALADLRELAADVTAADGPVAGSGNAGSICGTSAWEAARVARRRPRAATEVDAKALPHELDWLRTAVHLTKGCYRGQETVARVVNLGRPPRRLVQLHLDGSADHLPEPGTAVVAGTREVGRVTSVVRHADDGPLALALVRRALDPAAPLSVDGVAATQEVVVDPSGEPAERPAQPDRSALRRRDLR